MALNHKMPFEKGTMNKILIVDDSSTMRKIIQRTIRQTDLEIENVYEADNGTAALKSLESNPVDVIFSDINMPEMNGLELVKAVRADHPQSPLIIMVTTEGSDAIVEEAINSGANGYVRKPFTPEELEKALAEVLS